MEQQPRQTTSIDEELPMGYPVSPDLLMWEMSAADTLQRFQYSLKGVFFDKESKKNIKVGDPLANDEGIRMIVGFLSDYLSKDKILTDLSEDQINIMINGAMKTLVYHVMMNHKRYKIDKTNATIIMRRVEAFLVANLNRSIGGRTLDHQKPMIKRLEHVRPEQKKDGFFSWVPFFGGK